MAGKFMTGKPSMPTRDAGIDIFKGLLVFGMVVAHVIQFFVNMNIWQSARLISAFFNVVTFSGFLFCFGYVFQMNYMERPFREVARRVLANAFKILLAFYISAIAFRVLVTQQLTWSGVLRIGLLSDIPNYSEFLISFALFYFASLSCFPLLRAILEREPLFWTVCALLLLGTFIPYERITLPQIGLLIGTTGFAAFPVAQYLPLFLFGMYFSKNRILFDRKLFVGAIVCTAGYLAFTIVNQKEPSRFPPSFLYIVGSMAFLYGGYLLTKRLTSWSLLTGWIQILGCNVLFSLLASNLFLFATRNLKPNFLLSLPQSLGVIFIIIGVILYSVSIVTKSTAAHQVRLQ